MKIYAVGGAVRDELLGLEVKDRDFMVVGATPEEMTRLGYKPVGKDFPVFLHPQTHEEYALARTERKTSRGYKGFQVYASPDVTLEEDLARRDLTINAIAKDGDGNIIDPYRGVADIKAKILRHVSPAFMEDPVRILRVARFAARFAEFKVADETVELMTEMVQNGEVDALVPERVWQELSRGLMEARPSRMFEALRQCGALAKILPELDRLFGIPQLKQFHPEVDTGVHVMLVIDLAAQYEATLPVRFAALTHDLGKGTTPPDQLPNHAGHEARSVGLVKDVCQRIKVPNDCRDLAVLTARFHGDIYDVPKLPPEDVLDFLQLTDAIRQPERFAAFLQACELDYRGRPGYATAEFRQTALLRQALAAVQQVNAGAIARGLTNPETIKEAVYQARCAALSKWINSNRDIE